MATRHTKRDCSQKNVQNFTLDSDESILNTYVSSKMIYVGYNAFASEWAFGRVLLRHYKAYLAKHIHLNRQYMEHHFT